MIKELKSSFFQVFSLTLVFILVLLSIFFNGASLPINFIWNLVSISIIFATIFGLIYPALWSFSSIKAFNKIAISSITNTLGGIISIWLFSSTMFEFIKPYIIYIFISTIIVHIIIFYFYSKWINKANATELNNILNK